ncbi:SDR family NAD(P)-dependent oxidoreductase [Haliea sp. E17]|uniref:SDR family NAD(P)-dependent oxidoreductase n=1 Tax=Haliea sp. E17 TaxID=3401576 RepID=UPI003AAC3248
MTTFAGKYGPWALITGASEGTGAAFSRRAAAQGLNCILVARREQPLRELAAELQRDQGIETLVVTADLAAPDAAAAIIEAVGDREVGLYIANAGADTVTARFLDAPVEAWLGLMHLNVTTSLQLCHTLGGQMRERERGGILLLGSGVSYGGMGGLAVYAGSKSFMLSFGESLWSELRPYGVDVLNFMLGRTDTPALREILARNELPPPEGLASPDEVAEAGFNHLARGPILNWGQADDEAGMSPVSPAARRERMLAMEAIARTVIKT